MKGNLIYTGTVTYAIRGRDILRNNGIKAWVEKYSSKNNDLGCGFGVAFEGDISVAEKLLREKGVKILKTAKY